MRRAEAAREARGATFGDEHDDAELVRRAQLGSAAAFEALVVRHGARLHRYLRVELRHESDAHDAFQESLTAAWRGLPGLRRADRFWPWLVGIASHKAADIHRRRGRSVETEAGRDARRRSAARDERGALCASRRSTVRCCCSAICSGSRRRRRPRRSAYAWGRSSRGARGLGARCWRSWDETTSAGPGAGHSQAAGASRRRGRRSDRSRVAQSRAAGRRRGPDSRTTPGTAIAAVAPPPPPLGCGGCSNTPRCHRPRLRRRLLAHSYEQRTDGRRGLRLPARHGLDGDPGRPPRVRRVDSHGGCQRPYLA